MTPLLCPGASAGLASLALVAVACGAPARPAHEVSLAASHGVSAAPSALPLPSHRASPSDDSPAVVEQAQELLAECRRFFSLDTTTGCQPSFEPWFINKLDPRQPLPGHDERLHRTRTMLRLASGTDPETAAVGRFLLAHYASMIHGGDPHDPESLCQDPAIARRLFEVLERADESYERGKTLSDAQMLHPLSQLAVCGDIEALGLLERLQRLARRQMARDGKTLGVDLWNASWINAAAQNPRSRALRQLFIEGFEVAQPLGRRDLVGARPGQLGLSASGTVDEDFCAMADRYAMTDEPDDAFWTSEVFLVGECQTHRDRFLAKLDERLGARATLTEGPLMVLEQLCSRGDVPTLGRGQAFDRLKPLAGPANADPRTRAQALRSACQCDRVRARPLVALARRGTDASLRAAADSPACQP